MNMGDTYNVSITILNASGYAVVVRQLYLPRAEQAFAVPGIDHLPEGSYIINITWKSGKTISKPFIKRRSRSSIFDQG